MADVGTAAQAAGDIAGLRDALLAAGGGLLTVVLATAGVIKGSQRIRLRLNGGSAPKPDAHLDALHGITRAVQNGNARLDSIDDKLGTMNGSLERLLGRTDPRD